MNNRALSLKDLNSLLVVKRKEGNIRFPIL